MEVFGKVKRQLATDVENELYTMYKGISKDYKQRFRTLLFNLKDPKNSQLRDRVINGSITPTTLCKMTPAELAPKELAEYRKAKDEKYLKNIVIREEDQGKKKQESEVLRGETLLHTSGVSVPKKDEETKLSDIVDTSSLISNSTIITEEITIPDNFDSIAVPIIEDNDINSPPPIDNEPINIPSFNEFAKQMKGKSSGSREKLIKNPPKNKARKEKEVKEPPSLDVPKQNSPSAEGSSTPSQLPEEVGKSAWSGYLKLSTPKCKINAYHVSGERIDKYLPKEALTQVGRMDLKALYNYLSQLSLSSSRKLTLAYFEPASDDESFHYVSAFESFNSSGKAAVIKVGGNVREAFVFPLSTDAAIPDWLKNYTHGETDRLIGAFITSVSVKTDKKVSSSKSRDRPTTESPTSTPTPASFDSPVLVNGETKVERNSTPTSTPPQTTVSPPTRPLNATFPGNFVPPFIPGFPFGPMGNPSLLAPFNMGIPPTSGAPSNLFSFPTPPSSSANTSNVSNPASTTPIPQELISKGLNLLAQLKQMGMIPPVENGVSGNSSSSTGLSQQNINQSQNSQTRLQNT